MTAADLLAEGSLPRAWARRWAEAPDRPTALRPDGTGLTAAELARASAGAATALAAAGVRPGDRVVLSCRATLDTVVAHVGALRLGAVVVPMNTAYLGEEVAHVVGDAEPAAAVVDDPHRAALVAAADPAMAVLDPADLAATTPGGAHPPPALDRAGPGDPALLGYTSGTTGRPKGAVLSHGNLLASSEAVRRAWRWHAGDRLLLALPLFHMHGLGVGLHGTLLAGASAVVFERFDAGEVLAAVGDRGATLFFGVPTMYARLVAHPAAGALAALRLCVSGSAPLDPELFAAVEAASGQRVLERYGMTETAMLVSNPCDGERRPGTVGLPLPGVELRLRGEGAGADDGGGPPGEVLVRGPNVFAGYWRDPAATAEAFEGGWFRTGDIGELDEAGYLRLVGRAKELIITGGYNVYPREVEEVLSRHPAVAEVAVAGTPSAEWGEVVTAFVVAGPAGPPPEAELAALAQAHLAPYKRPRAVHVVEALPRNALGKVVRGRLRGPGPEG